MAFVLGDRAVEAARQSNLPLSLVEAIEAAPHYAEGTGVVLFVRQKGDLAAVQRLVPIKLAN